MTREIRNIAIKLHEIRSAHGFGSAFRSNQYNDIDLLVVFEKNSSEAFDEYIAFLKIVDCLKKKLGVKVDVTALTAGEAARNPLNESDHLVPLYEKTNRIS